MQLLLINKQYRMFPLFHSRRFGWQYFGAKQLRISCQIKIRLTNQTKFTSNAVARKFHKIKIFNFQITSVVQIDANGKEFAVTVTTDVVTLFVWLDSSAVRGRFSENGFLLVQATKTVSFYAEEAITTQVLSGSLQVVNLLDDNFL